MKTVYVTYAPTPFAQEFDLIERLCKYEGYTFAVIYPEKQEFKKYYKGGHPAILIYEDVDKDPTVLYGFWAFAAFLLHNGMLRC
jgi:hypothetical protein